jgi:arylsulfatase A-like enzyme
MKSPNFIIFLTDDQGYGDLSCMGCTDFCTPYLDRLAADGARFTNWYSNSPVCSPSRAALLTGRYPGNAGVRAILAGHRTATGLPPTTPTLAKALKELGYQTYLTGKWHLGVAEKCRPHQHGFDYWFGFLAGCIDYYSHIFYWDMNRPGPGLNPVHDLWENNQELWQNGEYFTEVITRQAIECLRRAKKSGKPFFLYVPYNAPHYPMHAPQKYVERFSDLPWDRRIMAAMLSAMDDSVGAIMAELKRLGMTENTLTFFTSDNGPSRESRNWLDGTLDLYYGGTTGQLKGHKFSLYEGGIRVPAIMHWPGVIPAGQVLTDSCASMDMFPTMLIAAEGNLSRYELDGTNLLPYVTQGNSLSPRDIYWEMDQQTAVRRGQWKLVLQGQLMEGAPPEDDVHLSNLADDPGERLNLKDAHPDIVVELTQAATAWREKLEKRWETEFFVPKEDVTIVTYSV